SRGPPHAPRGTHVRAGGSANRALGMPPAAGDPSNLALAWGVLGWVHSRLGEHHQAISCYRHALDLAHQRKTAFAARWLATLLTDFGDACQAAGDLEAARQAWQQALQIRDGLGLPDTRRIRARLEHASLRGPPD